MKQIMRTGPRLSPTCRIKRTPSECIGVDKLQELNFPPPGSGSYGKPAADLVGVSLSGILLMDIQKILLMAQAGFRSMQGRPLHDRLALSRRILALCALLNNAFWMPTWADEPSGSEQFFLEQVQPVLREHCLRCHSHAAGTMEGDLALDWRSGWEQGGSRGPAIIPGNPDDSLLIQAVRHTHPELRMPDRQISAAQLAVLEQWVRDGAVDPRTILPESLVPDAEWWSLLPLQRPPLPDTTEPSENSPNPIDLFIDEKLREQELTASPPADRRTLIRRLSVALLGILPTPEETQAFVDDPNPDAFEQLTERMLESPLYGERWARHWMDTIHFADSHGFEHDVFRPHAWRFRDYLIRSLNADLPWQDQIRAQLAADVFFPDSVELYPAIGFLGAGTYDHSAASTAPKNFENLDRDDLVTQTMTAFAGITVNCARCHDHKFDPVSQEDYYSLQAVFAGIGKGDIPCEDDPEVARRRRHWNTLRNAAPEKLSEYADADLLARIAAWQQSAVLPPAWEQPRIQSLHTDSGTSLRTQPDGSLLAEGDVPATETTVLTVSSSLSTVTAFRLEVLTDPGLPANGPGRAANGNLHLNEVEVRLFHAAQPDGTPVTISQAAADFEQDGWLISHAIDGDAATAWGIHPQEGQSHVAVFTFSTPVTLQPQDSLMITLRQDHGRQHVIGRLRVTLTDHPQPALGSVPAELLATLELPEAERTPAQIQQLHKYIVGQIAEQELQQLPAPQLIYAAATSAVNERGTIVYSEPRPIYLLHRGNVDQPVREVGPGALQVLQHLSPRFNETLDQHESTRRAALAEWLASPDNPLTWRTIANRVWHFHFGRGICDTPGDLGRMGGIPSHPHLLDWLACEIRDSGSLKQLHRLIVSSRTWQRSSQTSLLLQEFDPQNRLLARRSRTRLDADSWRDSVLRASGQLNLQMGGPGISYFSTSPGAQLTPILDYSDYDWNSPEAGRRSVYRVVWRGIPDPVMEALDFPDLGLLIPSRTESVSPLQSLTLMNNRFVLHQCNAMAQRIDAAATDSAACIDRAALVVWQRWATPEEKEILGNLLQEHGLPAVCRLLLNSNEFLSLD